MIVSHGAALDRDRQPLRRQKFATGPMPAAKSGQYKIRLPVIPITLSIRTFGVSCISEEKECGQMRIVLRGAMVLFGTFGYIAMGVLLTGTG